MENYRVIITFIFQTIIVVGISFGLIHALMVIGNFREKITKLFNDVDKLKNNSHRALNDIEKLKQSIKKISPDIYEDYWSKYKDFK